MIHQMRLSVVVVVLGTFPSFRQPFMHRVCGARRGIQTMVSEGARPLGRGRSELAKSESRDSLVCWSAL